MSISRRRFLLLSSAAAASAPFARLRAQAPASPRASSPTAFESVRRNVGVFTGRGGTIGILSNKDTLLVVDTQYPDTARVCLASVEQRAGRPVDLVFNTHHHVDHTAGNGVFRAHAKKIVAQRRVPDLQRTAYGTSGDPQTYADTTFDKTWSEHAGDERVTAKYYGPGHTGGDAIVHFERAHVVHMGDLIWIDIHPFIDRPGGASVQHWRTTVEAVAKEMPADTIYIAGHARAGHPVSVDRAALLKQRDYFDAALTHVRRGLQQHQSRDEIIALAALPGFEDYQSAPPRLSAAATLGAVYDELTS
ncbi:MAG TPA: MBL fold metallo-hydrolase [Vicinamibacterales bacterium]|nr:MBL fold metallo-hydrolase [Vicinamibacterales bacterium]